MPARLGPRFAIEALFLVVLAVAAGLAHLRPLLIVVVMSAAWAIVALLEWALWREGPRLQLRPYESPRASAWPARPDGPVEYPVHDVELTSAVDARPELSDALDERARRRFWSRRRDEPDDSSSASLEDTASRHVRVLAAPVAAEHVEADR